MTALIIITANTCSVILLNSLAMCVMPGSPFVGFARVFCAPAGVAL